MKRALPAMFSKVDTLARLVVRSLPTPRLAVAVGAPGRHGWSLDVEADGRSATVRAPGPAIAITLIGTGTARIALI
jgi:hypothetical protein